MIEKLLLRSLYSSSFSFSGFLNKREIGKKNPENMEDEVGAQALLDNRLFNPRS